MAIDFDLTYDEDKYDRNAENSFAPLPDGKYAVEVVDAEQREWDDGDSISINMRLQVMTGDQEGRTTFDSLAIRNEDPDRQGRGRKYLHRWCDIAGIEWPLREEEDLVGTMAIIELKTLKATKSGAKDRQVVVGREPYQPNNDVGRKAAAPKTNGRTPPPRRQNGGASNGMPF